MDFTCSSLTAYTLTPDIEAEPEPGGQVDAQIDDPSITVEASGVFRANGDGGELEGQLKYVRKASGQDIWVRISDEAGVVRSCYLVNVTDSDADALSDIVQDLHTDRG